VVAVVVVVVVVDVGAGVPLELHATESRPTATAAMPTVKEARLRTWAVFDNGISLSS
jgi:DNA gyrase/topoisomerase IV subunit B